MRSTALDLDDRARARSWASSGSRAPARASAAARSWASCRRGRASSSGSIRLEGEELVGLPESRYRRVRGERVAMIFQDPLTALDPLYRAGEQVAEALRFHFGLSRRGRAGRVIELFEAVGLPRPGGRRGALPARAVGRHAPARDDRDGARLRAGAAHRRRADDRARRDGPGPDPRPAADARARAAAWRSCSSPTTSASSASCASGRSCCTPGASSRRRRSRDLLRAPRHPYTAGLAASIPSIAPRRRRLPQIPGMPPDPAALPPGCAFAPRCPVALERCVPDRAADSSTSGRGVAPPASGAASSPRAACDISWEGAA